jgi:hypothetical protein
VQRAILSLTLLPLLMASAGPASAGGFDLRLGAFIPRARDCGIPTSQPAEYTLFQDVCELYFVEKSDWTSFAGGVEYNHVLARNLEIGVSVDGYSKTVDTSYRDFVRPDDSEIYQSLRVNIVPFGLTVRLIPTKKRTKVAPYLGGGIDLLYWKYEEFGDFIDFWDPDLPVEGDHFISSGVTFGFHAAGGVRFYLNRDFALVAEGRYQWGKATMGGDFGANEPGLVNRLDLGGASVFFGLHVRF